MCRVHLLSIVALLTGALVSDVLARGGGQRRHPRPPQVDADGDGMRGEEKRRAAREARRAELLEKYDADGDGTLSDEERRAAGEARRAKFLEKYDTDKDGAISDEERAAIREARDLPRHRRHHRRGSFHRPRLGPCPGEILEKYDADGDGTLSDEERRAAGEARRAEFLEKYDTDEDGTLSDEERRAAREARKAECEGESGERAALTAFRSFVRGDANEDGVIDVSDPVAILGYLFLASVNLGCLDAADANDDGLLDVSDPTAILTTVFLGGVTLPEPSTSGLDPTPDNLSCGP